MKSLYIKSTLIILLIFLLHIGCQEKPNIEKIRSQVDSINDQIVEAIMTNDHDSPLKLYTADGISLPSYQPMIKGIDALKAQSEKQKEMPMDMRSFNLTTTDLLVSGNFVIDIGTYDMTMGMPEAPSGEVKDNGKYLTLFEIQPNGSLLIKAETWNTDMNPWADMMDHGEDHKDGDSK